jgi:Domain of unknown function (DUF4291)
MMYRSGWGTKDGQQVVLAVQLRRAAFDTILSRAVLSSFASDTYASEAGWQRALAGRACTSTEAVDSALHAGVCDWNRHPTPFLWGRPLKPRRQLKRQYVYRI